MLNTAMHVAQSQQRHLSARCPIIAAHTHNYVTCYKHCIWYRNISFTISTSYLTVFCVNRSGSSTTVFSIVLCSYKRCNHSNTKIYFWKIYYNLIVIYNTIILAVDQRSHINTSFFTSGRLHRYLWSYNFLSLISSMLE